MRHQIDEGWPIGAMPMRTGVPSPLSFSVGAGDGDTPARLRIWLEQFSRDRGFQGARYVHLGHRQPGFDRGEPAPVRFLSTLGENEDPWRAGDPAAPHIAPSFLPFVWSTRDDLELSDLQRSWLSFERLRGFQIGVAIPVQDYLAGPAYLSLFGSNKVAAMAITGAGRDPLIGAAIDIHRRALATLPPGGVPSETMPLSERELSCLRQAAMGATIAETAMSLGIARRTVELYVGRATSKLGALNKMHAVAVAISSKLIQI